MDFDNQIYIKIRVDYLLDENEINCMKYAAMLKGQIINMKTI
jgi:hypothetical protein